MESQAKRVRTANVRNVHELLTGLSGDCASQRGSRPPGNRVEVPARDQADQPCVPRGSPLSVREKPKRYSELDSEN